MTLHRLRKGLDLPLDGAPEQQIHEAARVTRVAVLADDFPGTKPRMRVEEGARVRRGDVLFEDRSTPGVLHTAPGAGRVIGIHRGARRVLQSVVIDLSDAERTGSPAEHERVAFEHFSGRPAAELDREGIRALLVESGLWTSLRTRPYSRVPGPETRPAALFVTAIDTHPLAPRPEVVLEGQWEDFESGLRLVAKLTDGSTYLCVRPGSGIEQRVDAPVQLEEFAGPHPAGTVGVHIHLLEPAGRERTVWHLGYQDVAAIGRLFRTGRLEVGRVVALGGPPVLRPRLLRTRLGACVEDLAEGELEADEVRLVSGSALSGKRAMGDVFGYLGRYDLQLCCLPEGRKRDFMGWAAPGSRTFSVLPIFASRWLRRRRFSFTTNTHGSPRAMVPIGLYEKVMPMDILPTFLLRALLVGDIEQAEKLGALELDEEDLALCTFVDPGKIDYGPLLRRNLERMEREG
jgi:Na+-transporting NADH:ubiquinone oxidoreductase subunit A